MELKGHKAEEKLHGKGPNHGADAHEQEDDRHCGGRRMPRLGGGIGNLRLVDEHGQVDQQLTTAGINQPTTDPDNPNKPIPTDEKKVNGNLTETKWENNSKLAPGTSVPKNPNVGLGKGSENAYVFVAVTNKTASALRQPIILTLHILRSKTDGCPFL